MKKVIFLVFFFLSASPAFAASSTQFNYSGATSSWEVPADVYSVAIEAYGAWGLADSYAPNGALPGEAGSVSGTLVTTPGEILYFCVGGEGTLGGAGGFCGGGDASTVNIYKSGPGGGMTWVSRQSNFNSSTVIIVAAGGGGEGVNGGEGGQGGGSTGGAGGTSLDCVGAGGGTQSAGGAGGTADGGNNGEAGGEGLGGDRATPGSVAANGGGGGAGFFGGGGGSASSIDTCSSGGGGGSSFVTSTLTATSTATGVNSAAGRLIFTYTASPASSVFQTVIKAVNQLIKAGVDRLFTTPTST